MNYYFNLFLKVFTVVGLISLLLVGCLASDYQSANSIVPSSEKVTLETDADESNNALIPVNLTYQSRLFSNGVNKTNIEIDSRYAFAYCTVSAKNGFVSLENSILSKSVTISYSSDMSVEYSLSDTNIFTSFQIDEIKFEFYDSYHSLLTTMSIFVSQSSEDENTYELSKVK